MASAPRAAGSPVPVVEAAAMGPRESWPDVQPEVLPEATRQFLRPLIGIDPASVKVFRGEAAARVTAARGADALTIDEHVLLADGQPIDGPRGVALLAHELTHVARARQPRFVPPVALHSVQASPAMETASANDEDDEGVAHRVERAVRTVAKSSRTATSQFDASPASMESPTAAAGQAAWGGLPAPWEPLPSWLTSPSPEASPSAAPATTSAPTSSHPANATSAGNASNTGSDTSGPQVYAAEHGRDLQPDDAGESVTSAPQPHHEQQAVEPDLDALARQVYTLLRRRLASEQRRFG